MTQPLPGDTLASAVRRARRLADMTQDDLARRVGVKQQTISEWETAASKPTSAHLEALETTFDVSFSSLLEDDPSSPPSGESGELDDLLVESDRRRFLDAFFTRWEAGQAVPDSITRAVARYVGMEPDDAERD